MKDYPDCETETKVCPNCNIELQVAKFSDLETADGHCFDVWITYCSKCRYIDNCDAN